ncbi:dihydrolipoyl dehydrogenase family protein [Actinokineospora sp. 24-640]
MRDLVVVGGGTAGIIAAKTAGGLGADVVLVERDRTGGDCLWTGCVPSKALITAANTAHAMRTADRFGIGAVEPRVDLAAVLAHTRRAITRIAPVDAPEALTAAGVEVVAGEAVFTGPREIRVGERVLRFRHALVATGARPAVPRVPGLTDPLTSDTIWDLTRLPAALLVLGGGPVGCELGQAMARLGAAVTIVETADRLLPHAEPRASAAVAAALGADGVQVLTSASLTRIADGAAVVATASGERTVPVDRVLAATGRVPATAGLGLAAAGVATDERGHVRVDARLRTSNPRVLAAGDVTGGPAFTHVAGMQGSIAATNALLAPVRSLDPDAIPSVVFTAPEVAQVGLTEARARAVHGRAVRVRRLGHEHVDRAITEDAAEGFTAVVLDGRGRVLGATVVAPRAGEMLAELAGLVARRERLRDLAGVVHPYPTWADGVWNAAIAESVAASRRPLPRALAAAVRRIRRLLS